jgi:hypothetical protein
MANIHRSIYIAAPVSKVYTFMGDPMNNLKTMSSMVDVSDVKPLANGGASFRWKYKMAGITFDGSSQDEVLKPNQYREVSSKGGIQSVWKWSYNAEKDGTQLTLDLDYTVPVPVLGKLAEAIILKSNESETEATLQRIKGFCEAA